MGICEFLFSRVFASSIRSNRSIRSPRWPDPRRPRSHHSSRPYTLTTRSSITSLIITLCYPRAPAPPPTPRLVLLVLLSPPSSFSLLPLIRSPIHQLCLPGSRQGKSFSRPCTSRAFVDRDFLSPVARTPRYSASTLHL